MRILVYMIALTTGASCSNLPTRAPSNVRPACQKESAYRVSYKDQRYNDIENKRVRLNFSKSPIVIKNGTASTSTQYAEKNSLLFRDLIWKCDLKDPVEPALKGKTIRIDQSSNQHPHIVDMKKQGGRGGPWTSDHFLLTLEPVTLDDGSKYTPVYQCSYSRKRNPKGGNVQDIFLGRRSASDILKVFNEMFGVCVVEQGVLTAQPKNNSQSISK